MSEVAEKVKTEKSPTGVVTRKMSVAAVELAGDLSKAHQEKESTILAAGVVAFAKLTSEEKFEVIKQVKIAHAEALTAALAAK